MRRYLLGLVLLGACSSSSDVVVATRSDGVTVWCNVGEYYYECTPQDPNYNPPAGEGSGDGSGTGSGMGDGSGTGSGDGSGGGMGSGSDDGGGGGGGGGDGGGGGGGGGGGNCNPDGAPCPETPPECQPWPTGTATVLWPPNHKMHTYTLADCSKVDVCANGPAIAAGKVTKITVDEEVDVGAGGDGHTTNYDVAILDDTHFDLRSERQGGSDGRVYTVYYVDAANVEGSCQFLVPHNRGPHEGAVDSGTKVTVER